MKEKPKIDVVERVKQSIFDLFVTVVYKSNLYTSLVSEDLSSLHPVKTISIINPRRARMRSEGYCLCVCVSVKSHLTYGASVRPENAVTYSAGNEGQNTCGVFALAHV